MGTTPYQKVWSEEKCLSVLERYQTRCKTQTKRKRGNPQNVLHAVVCLNSMFETGKFCQKCGNSKGRIELHHIDFDWKNYSPSNLMFVCKAHHHWFHYLWELKQNRLDK